MSSPQAPMHNIFVFLKKSMINIINNQVSQQSFLTILHAAQNTDTYCQFTQFSKLIYALFVLCACIDYHHFKIIIGRQEACDYMLWFCRIVNDLMWCCKTFYCGDKCRRIKLMINYFFKNVFKTLKTL